jgi:hypothetical protein
MAIHEKLPDNFIEMIGQRDDQTLIKRFSGKTLLKIAGLKDGKRKDKIQKRLSAD